MTGRLLVTTPDAPLAPHTHARLRLASGRELRFVDPRRFGRLEFRELSRCAGFRAAGADPLTVTAEEFVRLFHRRRLAIKAALLNQKLLSGVGNIYADESLFRAGIRPRRLCGRLTRAELERLRLALRRGSGARHPAGRLFGFATTWMPTGCADSFNWNTASICARGFPAAAARRRSGALCWLDGGHITARNARCRARFYDFWRIPKRNSGIEKLPAR